MEENKSFEEQYEKEREAHNKTRAALKKLREEKAQMYSEMNELSERDDEAKSANSCPTTLTP